MPYLDRKQAAARLRDRGLPLSFTTLESMASRGGGPPMLRWGRRVVYDETALLTWAQARLSPPYSSTSAGGAVLPHQRARRRIETQPAT